MTGTMSRRFAVTTLTCNPTVDSFCETDEVVPTHKVRTRNALNHPGGGGVNVARVLQRFEVAVEACLLLGGAGGRLLDALLDQIALPRREIAIRGETRLSLTVFEQSTGREFRFVPEGPCLEEGEWEGAISAVRDTEADWLVVSGSLPRCAPKDLYARVAQATPAGTRRVLDTKGEELAAGLAAGGWFLVKPSETELEHLAGRQLHAPGDFAEAARTLIAAGQSEWVAATLGTDGAVLVSADQAHFLPAVPVETRSAVGAGDSFLAGFMLGLVRGEEPLEAFRLATAAGAATATTPGTDLCHPAQVEALLPQVGAPQPVG